MTATSGEPEAGIEHDASPNVEPGHDGRQDVEAGEDGADHALGDAARDAQDASGETSSDASADSRSDASEASADAAGDVADGAVDGAPDVVDSDVADSSVPPICNEGARRCSDYQLQVCTGNAWIRQVGDQTCCTDPRWSVVGTTIADSATKRTWTRFAGTSVTSAGLCVGGSFGGRLPTTAEALSLVIGPPVKGLSVCSPTIDYSFQNVPSGDLWTSDGCVDLARGVSKAACTDAAPGFLCVK